MSNLKKIESEAKIPTFKSPEEAAKACYFLTSWYKSYKTLKPCPRVTQDSLVKVFIK